MPNSFFCDVSQKNNKAREDLIYGYDYSTSNFKKTYHLCIPNNLYTEGIEYSNKNELRKWQQPQQKKKQKINNLITHDLITTSLFAIYTKCCYRLLMQNNNNDDSNKLKNYVENWKK